MNKPFLDLTVREALILVSGYVVITIGVLALFAMEPLINAIFS